MTLYLILIACLVTPARSSANWTADVTVPQDQLGCGSCYGFAITSTMEFFIKKITKAEDLIPLSTQYYVDCLGGDGCSGGLLGENLKFIEENQYHPYAVDYPFTGYYSEQNCIDGGFHDRTARNALADVWVLKFQKVGPTIEQLDEALKRGPTINGMVVSNDIFDWKNNDPSGVVDINCGRQANLHSQSFVGYTDQYYIVKGSYGDEWADKGFVHYNKTGNIPCNYLKDTYTVYLTKRREIEYKVMLKQKKNWDAAEAACMALDGKKGKSGWTLAIIPTKMHAFQVFDMFTAKYGTDFKTNAEFNYFWIGINSATLYSHRFWADHETPLLYDRFTDTPSKKFVKMEKTEPKYWGQRGRWASESKRAELRFVCSRFRAEECPRISQTAVPDARKVTFHDDDGAETLEIMKGYTANVECMPGYSGSAEVECQENGEWGKLPTCTKTD